MLYYDRALLTIHYAVSQKAKLGYFVQFYVNVWRTAGLSRAPMHANFFFLLHSVIERVPTERADDTVCMSGLSVAHWRHVTSGEGQGCCDSAGSLVRWENRGFSSGAAGKPFLLSEQVWREMRRAPLRRSRGCWWITIGMRSHHEPQAFPSHYQLLPLVSLIEAVLSGWLSPVVRCRDDCSRLGCATQDRGDLRRHRSCSPVRRDSAPRCPSHSQWVY